MTAIVHEKRALIVEAEDHEAAHNQLAEEHYSHFDEAQAPEVMHLDVIGVDTAPDQPLTGPGPAAIREVFNALGFNTLGMLVDDIVNGRQTFDPNTQQAAAFVEWAADNADQLWEDIVGPALDAMEDAFRRPGMSTYRWPPASA